jgi:hypothetical protein
MEFHSVNVMLPLDLADLGLAVFLDRLVLLPKLVDLGLLRLVGFA